MSFLPIKEDWTYEYAQNLIGGLNTSKPSIALDNSELLTASNIAFLTGKVVKDSGYIKAGGVVRGDVRATEQWFKTDGSSETLLITDLTFYKFVSSEWQYVRGDATTTTVNDEVAGQTVIEVPDTTGFSTADFIGISLVGGLQHRTTIASVSAGVSITLDDAIPVGANTGVAATVDRAVVLTGSATIQPSSVAVPNNIWFVFTNGIDSPQRYNGTDCVDIPNLPNAGNTQCRLVTLFNNYLLLMNTTEAGVRKPQRVRWSDTGDPTNWSTANAGFEDLYDSNDAIVATANIGPYIIVYRTNSIMRGDFINTATELIAFQATVNSDGCVAPLAVVEFTDSNLVIGNNSIYEYKAGFDVQLISDKIYYNTFSRSGDFNAQYKEKAFAFYVNELNEAWFVYTVFGQTEPTKVVRYNLTTKAWTTRTFPIAMLGYGVNTSTADKTWNDLVGTWSDQNFTWDARSLLSNAPIIHLCSTNNQVYTYDFISTDDDGTAIAYVLETKDFGSPITKNRFDMYDTHASGSAILVEYSIDAGLTWITLGTLTSNTLSKNTLYKQVVSNYIRFRFSGSAGFTLRDIGFRFIAESEF